MPATDTTARLARPLDLALRIGGFALKALRRIVDATLILLVAVMLLAVLVQIGGRYLFNYSIAGASELATLAQIWLVLLGAGYAMRERLHVSIDTFVEMLPPLLGRLVTVPVAILCFWFLYLVFEGGLLLMEIGVFQTSPALQIPMHIPYTALPAAAAYLALEGAMVFGAAILGIKPLTAGGGVRVD